MDKTIIIIPSRLSASRLKGKPLLEINKLPIICHVVKKAKESGIGQVVVATEDKEIVAAVEKNGGSAFLTGSHKTGTDRIFEAFKKIKIDNAEYVLNLQGDEPMIDPKDIISLNNLMIKNKPDIGTLASSIRNTAMMNNENIVKVITEKKLANEVFSKAVTFSRKNISNQGPNVYHHIGIYSYKISALKKFVSLSQSKNEIENRLEQLRALDNNIEINVTLAKSSPLGVDTKEDYLALKKIMEYKS